MSRISMKAELRPMSMKEQKDVMLDELAFLDSLCRQNGIEYTVIGGSLLGSVRHQGFIPWDDDIDIALRLDQYDKLIDLLKSDPNPRYGLYHPSCRKAYLPFAKLFDRRTLLTSRLSTVARGTGVFVDIFPYFVIPDDLAERTRYHGELHRLAVKLAASNTHGLDYASGPTWKSVAYSLVAYLPAHLRYYGQYRQLAAQLAAAQGRYMDGDDREVAYFLSIYQDKEHFPRDIFDSYEDAPFENLTVRKLKDHDAYLTQIFGDYRQLPPEDKRHTHSYYQAFWKSR